MRLAWLAVTFAWVCSGAVAAQPMGLHLNWDANPERVDSYIIYMAQGAAIEQPDQRQAAARTDRTAYDFKPAQCVLPPLKTGVICFWLKAFIHCDKTAWSCETGELQSPFSEPACITLQACDLTERGLPCAPARSELVIR